MEQDLRLVVFDVDGTLVDSQNDIVAAMKAVFEEEGLAPPAHADVLATVGLSLPKSILHLAPDAPPAQRDRLVALYKQAYRAFRSRRGSHESSPLFDGVGEALRCLHAVDPLLMGIATGKSRRGLNLLLDAHALRPYFVTQQCADDHPSKPHPSMLQTAMADTGVAPEHVVMVGDTEFDLAMARAAGVMFVGVTWGYHARTRLQGADRLVEEVTDLTAAVLELGRLA